MSATIRHPFDDIPAPGTWTRRAACRGAPEPNRWFPDPGGRITAEVQAVCDSCPVRFECLDYAVHWKIDHGIWGGFNTSDRKRLRRRHLTVVS